MDYHTWPMQLRWPRQRGLEILDAVAGQLLSVWFIG